MKKVFIIILSVVIIIALIFTFIFFAGFAGGGLLYSNPPKPEITYGEFPFSITYEINGEIKVTEDTLICEFDGFETLGEAGKYRKWKAHLKSENEQITLFKIDATSEIYCADDLPEYYMGDLKHGTKEDYEQTRDHNLNSMFLIFGQREDGALKGNFISTNEAWEKYKFKIIDRKYSQPITNSFK